MVTLPDLLQALYSLTCCRRCTQMKFVVMVAGTDEWQRHVGRRQERGATRQSQHMFSSPLFPFIDVLDKWPELSSWQLSAYSLHRNTPQRTPCHVDLGVKVRRSCAATCRCMRCLWCCHWSRAAWWPCCGASRRTQRRACLSLSPGPRVVQGGGGGEPKAVEVCGSREEDGGRSQWG